MSWIKRYSRRAYLQAVGACGASVLLGLDAARYFYAESRDPTMKTASIAPSAPLPDLIVGDSMASYCDWPNTIEQGYPTMPIRDIQRSIGAYWEKGGIRDGISTLYIFIGTADACFPAGMDLHSYTEFAKTASISAVQSLIDSSAKLNQLVDDYRAFVGFVKTRARYRKLVLISPFPDSGSQNFSLIEKADDALSKIFPDEYVDVNDFFYRKGREGFVRDDSNFRDSIHLSSRGYHVLREQLGVRAGTG